jgi:ADP-heptose:LPS heptosyltransferase
VHRILVVRGGAIGDFILTLPVLRALRESLGACVHVLANRNVAPLWASAPFALDEAALAPLFVRDAAVSPRILEWLRQYDCAITYLHDPEGVFVAHLARAGINRLIAAEIPSGAGPHAAAQLAAPLLELGMPIHHRPPRVDLTPAEIAFARQRFGFTDATRFVALHPGSGSRRKNWPLENWIALARQLVERERTIVFVGGEAETQQIAALRAAFGSAAHFAIDWPLRTLGALLAGSTFAGHDSGISHLAAASGARSVVLFGPTDPAVWAPPGQNVRVLNAENGDLTNVTVSDLLQELIRIGMST